LSPRCHLGGLGATQLLLHALERWLDVVAVVEAALPALYMMACHGDDNTSVVELMARTGGKCGGPRGVVIVAMYTHSQSASVVQWGSHIVASAATRSRADVSALVRSCCVQVVVTALRRHVRDDATLHGVSAVLSAGLKHCDDDSVAAHACASGVSAALLALVCVTT
jgi:hypothetical protein